MSLTANVSSNSGPKAAGTPQAGTNFFQQAAKLGTLTPEIVDQIAEVGQHIEFKDVVVDWAAVKKEFRGQQNLSDSHALAVRDFTAAVTEEQKRLRKQLKDDEKLAAPQMQRLHQETQFLKMVEGLRESYRESCSKTAIAAAAGASFGPLATVAAYLAWNPASKEHTKKVISGVQALEDGKSPLLTQSNNVQSVPQEKLWKSMLNLLDDAIAQAEKGKPVEIDVQYFEMTSSSFVGRLAKAASAGCKVRVNIDPSRPLSPSATEMTVDDGPRKLRALLQLSSLDNVDVGVSIFPVFDKLGSTDSLMHRKLLRVGDTVLLGGMNANEGSGENFDTGYLLKGPAAQKLVEGFQADLRTSTNVQMAQVYGSNNVNEFLDKDVLLTPHGLLTTFDAVAGPTPAGTRLPSQPTMEELQAGAAKLGVDLQSVIEVPLEDLQKSLKRGSTKPVALTSKGKELLGQLVERVFQASNKESNIKRLGDVSSVELSQSGTSQVAVGSEGEEREAMILHAISTADKFIYAPTFVITKAIARAIVARRDELRGQGKELDVKVVADSGVYGYGATPNEDGVFELEQAHIPVHWSMLVRAEGKHDRKIHAKQVLTDKMELIGSTNLSNKGIRENWELSGLVYFEGQNDPSMLDSVKRFEKLWKNESVAFDSWAYAERLVDPSLADGAKDMALEEARHKGLQSFLGALQGYEMQSAKFVEQQLENPKISQKSDELQQNGMAWGYARIEACKSALGEENFYESLHHLPAAEKIAGFNIANAA